MVKKLNPILVQRELKERKVTVFTPVEFKHIFDVSESATRKFISTHTKKDFFTRLRNGLYTLSEKRPNVYFMANKVYFPSYVSLETALSYHGIIPEVVYSITSVTTKPKRNFEVFGMDFSYTSIKKEMFQGYAAKKGGDDVTFLMAEPEKALADYLYLVSLGKRSWNDRLYVKNISLEKLQIYCDLFDRPKMKNLLECVQKL